MSSFLNNGREWFLRPDDHLYLEGQTYQGDEVMVTYIMEGEVAVERFYRETPYLSLSHQAGDFLAADVVFGDRKARTSARAVTACKFYSWPQADFEKMVGSDVLFAVKVLSQLSKRLRILNQKLTTVLARDSGLPDPQAVFDQGLRAYNSNQLGEAKFHFERFVEQYPEHAEAPRAIRLLYSMRDPHAPPGFRVMPAAAGGIPQDARLEQGLKQLASQGVMGNIPEALAGYLRSYAPGQVLFKEGEAASELFLIVSGKVLVSKEVQGQKHILGLLGNGNLVGEMALFDNKPRSATVEAMGKVEVLALNLANFKLIVQLQPQWMAQLIRNFAQRIHQGYHDIGKEYLESGHRP